MSTIQVIAEAASSMAAQAQPEIGPFVQGGALGLLALVLWRVLGNQTDTIKEIGARLDHNSDRVDRLDSKIEKLANAMLLEACTRENVPPAIRTRAEQMLNSSSDHS